MRIGTWNLEGRWSGAHLGLLATQDCDVWLLTEVRDDVSLPGFQSHLTTARMGDRKHWAGIFVRGQLESLPDPHPASAAAFGMGLFWCSSILPWRSCGSRPWAEGTTSQKTTRAVVQLMTSLPIGGLVWGGDWNHAMQGREYVGSIAGRTAIQQALTTRRLKLATQDSPHRIPGLFTIDHIAVPEHAEIQGTSRTIAEDHNGRRLSDHDAYTTGVALA